MIYTIVSIIPTGIIDLFIALGALGWLVSMFIPKYDVIVKLASLSIFSLGLWACGIHTEKQKYALELEKQKAYIAQLEQKASEKTIEVVTNYVDRIKIVKEKGDVIYEKVPQYITKEDDSRCVIPNGFVILHDSAVHNTVPETPRDSNEGTSGIELSEATKVIVKNYGTYHEVVEQLLALQKWVREMEANYNNKN